MYTSARHTSDFHLLDHYSKRPTTVAGQSSTSDDALYNVRRFLAS
jgi:hypothetical protein